MPNTILFDDELSDKAKLVLCYLMSLSGSTGQCRPRNKHLAEKFHISTRQVTRILEELGAYIYCGTDERGRRYIAMAPEITGDEPGRQKCLGGTTKMSIHSNSNSNEKVFPEETLKQIKKIHQRYVQLFKVDRDAWRAASTTDEKRELVLKAISRYKLTPARKAKIATRLNDAGFEMIMGALNNADKNPWNHGENDTNWKMDLYDYLLRNYEMVERWANQGGVE